MKWGRFEIDEYVLLYITFMASILLLAYFATK